jgi:hypothetical protein
LPLLTLAFLASTTLQVALPDELESSSSPLVELGVEVSLFSSSLESLELEG